MCTDSRRKSVGRLRRSVEMMTQRPVTGSLRSSDIDAWDLPNSRAPDTEASNALGYTMRRGWPGVEIDGDHVEAAGTVM